MARWALAVLVTQAFLGEVVDGGGGGERNKAEGGDVKGGRLNVAGLRKEDGERTKLPPEIDQFLKRNNAYQPTGYARKRPVLDQVTAWKPPGVEKGQKVAKLSQEDESAQPDKSLPVQRAFDPALRKDATDGLSTDSSDEGENLDAAGEDGPLKLQGGKPKGFVIGFDEMAKDAYHVRNADEGLETFGAVADDSKVVLPGGFDVPSWPGNSVNSMYVDMGKERYYAHEPPKGYLPDFPNAMKWGERPFEKTDNPYAEILYEVYMPPTKHTACQTVVEDNCGEIGDKWLEHKVIFNTNAGLRSCLDRIPSYCSPWIAGVWNYTRPHPPELCVSHSIGMRLPSPGGVVPVRDCVYKPLRLYSVIIRRIPSGMIEEIEKFKGKGDGTAIYCPLDVGPFWKGCRCNIEWGRINFPDASCPRPNWQKGDLVHDFEWSITASRADWSFFSNSASSVLDDSYLRLSYRGFRADLTINFENTRFDRDDDGFVWAFVPDKLDTEMFGGSFYAAEQAFICVTAGRKNLANDKDEVAINVVEAAAKGALQDGILNEE